MQATELNTLNVFVYLPGCGADGILAGKLSVQNSPTSSPENETEYLFTYDEGYLASPDAFSIDPVSLSFVDIHRPSKHVFRPANGLAEFGAFRDATPDAWGRRVTEALHQARLNTLSEVDYLLAAGGDRVGGLDVREASETTSGTSAAQLDELPHLLHIASAIEFGNEISPVQYRLLGAMTCAGGARPKASVRDTEGALWLAKFPSHSDGHDVVTAEYGAMKLALHCGLIVPEVQRTIVSGRPVLLVRRFDRYWAREDENLSGSLLHDTRPAIDAQEFRSPFISALTLLGCSEFESPYKSYSDLAKAIRQYVHPNYRDKDTEELFKRMVFNILINNDDDHLRNHGFIYDFRIQGWRLSPLYDVVPRPSFAYERRLHLNVGRDGKVATLENALSSYSAFVESREDAIRIMSYLWQGVSQWRSVFAENGATEELIAQVSSAFRPLEEVAGCSIASEIWARNIR